jgi:carbon monoxide dehydrogenase subunit G
MEVKLDKRYPIDVSLEQAWAVLSDIRATAGCMPGAAITEQIDDTHYKGTVRSKVGPAVMTFGGDIEVLEVNPAEKRLQMLGKGADKSGSSASMNLTAHLEPGEAPGSVVLVGVATVIVSGKLAQFGSRLLVPVSDAMLAQFAGNFRNAAAAVPVAVVAAEAGEGAEGHGGAASEGAAGAKAEGESLAHADGAASGAPEAAAPAPSAAAAAASESVAAVPPAGARASPAALMPLAKPSAPPPVKELDALALIWIVIKGWFAGLIGRKS